MVNYSENTAGMIRASSRNSERVGYSAVKRIFDFTVSLLLLILLALPMLFVAMAVLLDSNGGAVFSQTRVGMNGREFKIYKFRTMKRSAPSEMPTSRFACCERYLTRVGRFLRRTSIDELPQLINILKGDMSFVGPRPLIRGETNIHQLRCAAGVYSVRPGMTGWAQINGRDEISDDEKVRLDAEYVRRRSIRFDISIILKTIMVVIRGDGFSDSRGKSA